MTCACQKYIVDLTQKKGHFNLQGKSSVYKINHARILLKADTNYKAAQIGLPEWSQEVRVITGVISATNLLTSGAEEVVTFPYLFKNSKPLMDCSLHGVA